MGKQGMTDSTRTADYRGMNNNNGGNSEVSPQLLDLLIPKDTEKWHIEERRRTHHKACSEEMKLQLTLAPPGEEEEEEEEEEEKDSLISLGYFSTHKNGSQTQKILSSSNGVSSFLHTQPSSANTAVSNISQKRTAPGPVVGWPPIRSFRKNIASSSNTSSKTLHEVITDKVSGKKPAVVDNNNNNVGVGGGNKGLFVKINMDGVPIGRKVDLNAYDSYEKLSSAVDELFRGLLAAQRDSCGGGIQNKKEEEKAINGVLDGKGEYTLVYEDNEGDRMLVGDVPWQMFVSTVKRLRVLKSSELSTFTLGSKQDKDTTNMAV